MEKLSPSVVRFEVCVVPPVGVRSEGPDDVCLTSSPNFYILDEPTNHLDMETIEALAKALGKFKVGPFVHKWSKTSLDVSAQRVMSRVSGRGHPGVT